jgi:hypothetical protein
MYDHVTHRHILKDPLILISVIQYKLQMLDKANCAATLILDDDDHHGNGHEDKDDDKSPPMALQSLKDLGRLTYRRFLELFRQMVGLLGQVISPLQGLYLHRTTQHRKTRTNIHALSEIRTHGPSNQPAKTHASDRMATVTGNNKIIH